MSGQQISRDGLGYEIGGVEEYTSWLKSENHTDLYEAIAAAGGWYKYLWEDVDWQPPSYQEALAKIPIQGAKPHVHREIEVDVTRTYPGHCRSKELHPKVERVLRAYAAHNPTVGYCQGMNFIVGICLTVMTEEETWCILTYIADHLLSDYYQRFIAVIVDEKVVQWALRKGQPKLMEHLDNIGATFTCIYQCLIPVYAHFLPAEAVLRVWKTFFLGGRIFLIRTIATLIATAKDGLMGCRDPEQARELLKNHCMRYYNGVRLVFLTLEGEVLGSNVDEAHIVEARREAWQKHEEEQTALAQNKEMKDVATWTELSMAQLNSLREEFDWMASKSKRSMQPTSNRQRVPSLDLDHFRSLLTNVGIDNKIFCPMGAFRQWSEDEAQGLNFYQLIYGLHLLSPTSTMAHRLKVCITSFDITGDGFLDEFQIDLMKESPEWKQILDQYQIGAAQSQSQNGSPESNTQQSPSASTHQSSAPTNDDSFSFEIVDANEVSSSSPRRPVHIESLLELLKDVPEEMPSLVRDGITLERKHFCSIMELPSLAFEDFMAKTTAHASWLPGLLQGHRTKEASVGEIPSFYPGMPCILPSKFHTQNVLCVPPLVGVGSGAIVWSKVVEDTAAGLCLQEFAPGIGGVLARGFDTFLHNRAPRSFRVQCTQKPFTVLAEADTKEEGRATFEYLLQLTRSGDLGWQIAAYRWLAAFEKLTKSMNDDDTTDDSGNTLHRQGRENVLKESLALLETCCSGLQLWEFYKVMREIIGGHSAFKDVSVAFMGKIELLFEEFLKSQPPAEMASFESYVRETMTLVDAVDFPSANASLAMIKSRIIKEGIANA